MTKTNVERLAACLGSGASVIRVTYRGRAYAVTTGTGEMNFGAEGGGSAAFAYQVSALEAATLRPDGWDYAEWCNSSAPAPVDDRGLARKLARDYGLRLARAGACDPVLDDAAFRAARG